MPAAKRKPEAKSRTANAEVSPEKSPPYGHYARYEAYCESIVAKPMEQLFGLLKEVGKRKQDWR